MYRYTNNRKNAHIINIQQLILYYNPSRATSISSIEANDISYSVVDGNYISIVDMYWWIVHIPLILDFIAAGADGTIDVLQLRYA